MSVNNRYGRGWRDEDEGYDSRRRMRIDFDDYEDEAPANRRRSSSRRGDDDDDWSDHIDERGRGYARDPRRAPRREEYYREEYYEDEEEEVRSRRRNEGPERRRRRRDDEYEEDMEKPTTFVKRHPVLMNMIYIITTGFVLVMVLLWFLDFWTFHGQERVVPDVKGEPFATAASNVDVAGLRAVITDSVFDSYTRPGTVVEQMPIPGAKIKKGGTVYLTVVAFSPKLITVPDFYNVSVRQARSMFEGVGVRDIREVPVMSEYKGLVLGAKFNGVALQPGARIPVSAIITLEVGSGYDELEIEGADIDSVSIDNVIEELNID